MLQQRIQNLRGALPQDFEAALIVKPENRFYFLDFDSHGAGTLLVLPQKVVFIIDSRYIEIAKKTIQHAEVVLEEDALRQTQEILCAHGVQKLYLEDTTTLKQAGLLQEKIPNVEFDKSSTLSGAISALRAIKSSDELERIRTAQRITDACFTHILPFIKEGVSEIDIMLEMEYFMRSHGAEKVAFDTICVAGKNSSMPHGVPGEYKIRPGDFITLDFGAKYKGYCADMTRTLVLGTPGEEQRKVYDTVLKAHLAGIEAARAGMCAYDVDKAARDIIYGAGYEGCFGHGLGHAVGIEIHEDPRFSPVCTSEILPGMVLTVEPGCYLAGRFGCRIEDMVVITQGACEPLPTSPKELIVL